MEGSGVHGVHGNGVHGGFIKKFMEGLKDPER